MKRTLLTLVLLVMVMTVGAQSVKVDYHKGDVRMYKTNVSLSMGIPMQGEQKCGLTAATTYTVDEAGADGYIVELKADDYSTTGNADLVNMVGGQFFETLKSTPAKLKLDKKGAITGLANEDAFIAAISSTVVEGINKMYADRPGLESQMPKAKLLMAANSQLTPEFVLNFFKNFTVFSLNGRDLANVKNADETIYDFFKVKSSYDVSSANGTTTITRTAVSNMTDDDLKGILKKQMSQAGQDVDDTQLEQIWGQLKAMGMTSCTIDLNDVSNFGNGGWQSSANTKATIKAVGATIKVNAATSLAQ